MPLPNCTLQQQSLAAMLANVNLPQTQCYIGCAAPLKSRTPGLPFIGQTSYVCLLIAARLCMYVSHTYIHTDSTTSTVHIIQPLTVIARSCDLTQKWVKSEPLFARGHAD